MKTIFLAVFLANFAQAAPTESQINSTALEALLRHAGTITAKDKDNDNKNVLVSTFLANSLPTSSGYTATISNRCTATKTGVNCILNIYQKDPSDEEGTESATMIEYNVGKDGTGKPTKAAISRAG